MKKECPMSNESNREPGRSISPSDLQASDFFPPGHGWNQEEDAESTTQSASRERERRDDETASDGSRRH
jgi:hypothetical protein